MKIKWTRTALQSFHSIESAHFTEQETVEYKKKIAREIERKITTLKTSMPTREENWKGTYRILVDRYKVYYSFSEDQQICYIEGFRHQRQLGK